MAWFSKFELLFALKQIINGGQMNREISKYGYINNLQIIIKIVKFAAIKKLKICDGKLIKNKVEHLW